MTKISLGGFELSRVALGVKAVCKRMFAHSASVYKFSREVIIKNMARKLFKYSSTVDIRRQRRKEV